ncbi:unnamed protein product [Caenorhabditis angaria]|uniref:Uncharacterized protein n=1 Tax=Caenorhabditis angaria TaxID=860376 RepID=A0A9P1MXI5_9PELO|nr:unnamed protein product [Caenorhabditis angaria]
MSRVSKPRACKTRAAEAREQEKKGKKRETPEQEKKSTRRVVRVRCYREDVMRMFQDPNLSENDEEDEEEYESHDPKSEHSCRLCNDTKKARKMTEVPKEDFFFDRWGRSAETFMRIGDQPPTFFENCRNNPAPHFICNDHVGELLFGVMQLPRIEMEKKERGEQM